LYCKGLAGKEAANPREKHLGREDGKSIMGGQSSLTLKRERVGPHWERAKKQDTVGGQKGGEKPKTHLVRGTRGGWFFGRQRFWSPSTTNKVEVFLRAKRAGQRTKKTTDGGWRKEKKSQASV